MTRDLVPQRRVSWRARIFLSVCRKFIKPQMTKPQDLATARKFAARLDALLGGKNRSAGEPIIGPAGLKAQWIDAGAADPTYTVLYLHGGGFMFHLPAAHGRLAARICRQIGATALMPDYRCAPEFPLPAAHEDCLAAYQWLLEQRRQASRIVLAGDSAGGLLVLATLQRIRDAGLPAPLCGVMFSPGTCVDSVRALTAADTEGDPMIGPGALELLQRQVIDAVPVGDATVSPCAGRLNDLPPLLFQVGSTEMLLNQARRGFEMARAAGTHAELQIWPEMPHVWQAVSWLPEAREALRSVADFVERQRTTEPIDGITWESAASCSRAP